jgi:hypothetical protein
MRRSCAIAAALGLVGCGSETLVSALREMDVFEQAPSDRVDILFVIDDSRSMGDEQQALADGFTTFLGELEASPTLWRIGVVSTTLAEFGPESPLLGVPQVLQPGTEVGALFRERVQMGVSGSDKEKGLWAASQALWGNAGFVREGANLVVVFVTDEDDCSDDGALDGWNAAQCYERREELVPVEDLVDRIVRVKRQGELVRLGGILGPLDDSCGDDALPGSRYAQAVKAVGGPMGRICDEDWTPVLRQLGAVAAGILEQFELSSPAAVDTIEVSVDEVPVLQSPDEGWTYDWQSQLLSFHGEAVPPRGSTIVVEYDVAPPSM